MDQRFARIKTDPRFKRPRKDQHTVVVDERFKSIFEKAKGKGKNKAGSRIDKYGRRVSATKERDDIRKFYRLEDEEDEQPEAGPSDPEKAVSKRPDYARGEALMESSDEGEEDADSAEEGPVELGPARYQLGRKAKATQYEDDVPSDFEINLDEAEFVDLDAEAAAYSSNTSRLGFGEQKRTTQKGQETRRIAVVNLDWDHVKAAHLFKVFNSCAAMADDAADAESANGNTKRRKKKSALPAGRSSRILRVTVYPSEFGKERMAKEDVEGPPVEIYADPKKRKDGKNILTDRRLALGDDEDLANIDVEDINEKTIYHQEDAEQYDQDALRQYQLERLRYYYAIVECDTPETAAYVYKELDATELERTANLLDLSFVPDEMEFDDEFRDEATQDLGNLKPLKFETDALRSSKVKLTWDDDDKDRAELTRRPLTAEEIEANDFKAYLANTSDSSSEDENPNEKAEPGKKQTSLKERKQAERDRLRNLLLGGGGGDGGDGDDFFVNPDLPEGWGDGAGKNKAAEMEITFTPGLTVAKKDGQGSDDEENMTTLERYKKKMKEQKLARMTKLEKQRRKNNGQDDVAERDKASAKRGDGVGKDGFFELEGDEDDNHSDEGGGGRKSKTSDSRRPSTKEELALLTADINSDDGGRRHFDMAKVIKAEKMSSKKKQKFKKRGQHNEETENGEEAEDGRDFEINVQDKRFQALHDEYEFAIDPSNPHFKKTKAMTQLLDERRRRLKDKVKADAEGRRDQGAVRKTAIGGNGDLELQRLVQNVKRKSGADEAWRSDLSKREMKRLKPSN